MLEKTNPTPTARGIETVSTATSIPDYGKTGDLKVHVLFSRLTIIAGLIAFLFGILGLVGIYSGIDTLRSIYPGYQTMAFNMAFFLLLFGMILTAGAVRPFGRWLRAGTRVAMILSVIIGAVELLLSIRGGHSFFESLMIGIGDMLAGQPTSAISPFSLILMMMSAIGILLLTTRIPSKAGLQPRDIEGFLGLGVVIVSFTFVLGYLYGNPLIYGTGLVPVAAPTALAFLAIGTGLVTGAGPEAAPARFFLGNSIRAHILRTFLPLTIVIILAGTALDIVRHFVGDSFNAILTSVSIVVFSLVILLVVIRASNRLSDVLEISDRNLRKAEQDLRIKNTELEASYEELTATEEELRANYIELTNSQQELRKNIDLFRASFDYAGAGMVLTSPDGRILQANAMLCSMLGYSEAGLLGQSFRDFIYQEDTGSRAQSGSGMIDDRLQVVKAEQRFLHRDGHIVWATMSSVLVHDELGYPKFSIIHIIDITERMHAEEEIRTLNHDLERRVEERTIELTELSEELRANNQELARQGEELAESREILQLKLNNLLSPDYDIEEDEFANIINSGEIQSLMDEFYALTQLGVAIIDVKGVVLVATGWQDICTKFHRANPESCRNCLESDIELTRNISPGEFKVYQCKNHMWDVATPIIIGGKHVGNLFFGQFFFTDEPSDSQIFTEQAEKYGFDTGEYLAALKKVPRVDRDTIKHLMAFYSKLASVISDLSYSNLKLAKVLAENRQARSDLEHRNEELINMNEELASIEEELRQNVDELITKERELREGGERLNRAEAIAHLGSWELNLAGNKLSWSDEVYRIFGLKPQEFGATYEAFLDAIHPDDRADVDDAYSGSLHDGRDTYEIEHRVVRKDNGETRIVHEKCEHIRDDDGRIVRSTGMVHDITERRKAELALKTSEAESRAILNATRESIYLFDVDGTILQMNITAAERFNSKNPEEFIGHNFSEFISRDLAQSRMARLIEVIDSKRPVQFEDRRDGIIFDHTFYPVVGNKGKVTAIAAFNRDITEHKKMTEQIEASLAEKETLLREVHHRVKNNLQIISSILSMQIRKLKDQNTIEALRDSQNRVMSIALVHEHLYGGKDFSHIDLKNYLKALGRGLFQSYNAADMGVRFDMNLQDIYVDLNSAIPLGLITNELITNSLKYAFREKKDGKISITALEAPNALTFIVGDNGGGIPGHITLENQDSLGLRLVNSLTGQLHGTVALDRTEGTKFVFTIPRQAGTKTTVQS